MVIKEYIYQEKKNYFLIILFMVYAFICGKNLNVATATGLSTGEFILYCITDHYYIIYGFFFYGMYWMFRDSKEESDLEMLRFGSYNRYYLLRCAVAFIKILIFVVLHIVIAGAVGIGQLGLSMGFTGQRVPGYYIEAVEFILVFKEYFANAGIATLVVGAFLILGMFFIYEILFYIQKIRGNKAEIVAMIIILTNVMMGFKSHIDESMLEVLFLNNYFILHHCLFLVGKNAVMINIVIVVAVSIVLNRMAVNANNGSNNTKKRKALYIRHMFADDRSMLLFVVIVLGLKLVMVIRDKYTALDYVLSCIQGFSVQNVDIINILYYLAFFTFPIFIVMCFLENEKQGANILARFRFDNRKQWDGTITKICYGYLCRYSICYWLGLTMITLMVWIFTRNRNSVFWNEFLVFYELNNEQMLTYILATIVLHILELFVVFEVAYMIRSLSGSTIVAFIGLIVIYVAVMLFKIDIWINPFGSSAIYNMVEQEHNLVARLLANVLWISVLHTIRSKVNENGNRIKECS